MCFVTVEDFYGSFEAIVFSDPFEKYKSLLINNNMLLLTGRISKREEEKAKLIVNEVKALEYLSNGNGICLKLSISNEQVDKLDELKAILEKFPGNSPVILNLITSEEQIEIEMQHQVNPNGELIESLSEVLNSGNISLANK